MANSAKTRAGINRRWLWGGLFVLFCGLALSVMPARAEDEPPPRAIVVAPRAEGRIGDKELVKAYPDSPPGVPATGKLIVYLQRYTDGIPTTGAKIDVTIDFISETLTEIGPGVYSSASLPISSGRNDV